MCMRSSRRGSASAHANLLPNPFISGSRNAGALNGYRIAGFERGGSGILHLPSLVARVAPSLHRAASLSHCRCLLVHPSPSSHFLARFPHSFRSSPFPPLSPSNRSSSPSISQPPLIRRTCVRTLAYTSLLLTTTLYYRHSRTYYYEKWRIDDLSSRPSSREPTARFLPGNFQES